MGKFRESQQIFISVFQFFFNCSKIFKFQPLLNCIGIVDEDLVWANGIVQRLSAPLPKATTQTLLEIIESDPNFSSFNACKLLNCLLVNFIVFFLNFKFRKVRSK